MYRVIIFALLYFRAATISAQVSTARNSIYAEGTSYAPYYALRYDRIFHTGNVFSKSFSAGIALRANDVGIPIGIHFLQSRQGPHHLELGLTLMPYVENYRRLFANGNPADKKLYVIPGLGYRRQPEDGGFFLRLVLAPVLLLDPASDDFWKMSPTFKAGASGGVGYSF